MKAHFLKTDNFTDGNVQKVTFTPEKIAHMAESPAKTETPDTKETEIKDTPRNDLVDHLDAGVDIATQKANIEKRETEHYKKAAKLKPQREELAGRVPKISILSFLRKWEPMAIIIAVIACGFDMGWRFVIEKPNIENDRITRAWQLLSTPGVGSGAKMQAIDILFSKGETFKGVKLFGTNFQGAKLSDLDFSGADFLGANLSEADLSRANLSRASFSQADLSRTSFRQADLSRANLSKANLHRADFSRTDLDLAIFQGAEISGAKFKKDGISAINLNKSQLEKAIITVDGAMIMLPVLPDGNFDGFWQDVLLCELKVVNIDGKICKFIREWVEVVPRPAFVDNYLIETGLTDIYPVSTK